jgi:hypothetical protein
MGLLAGAATAGALPRAPGATVGGTVGAELAEPHPALIRPVRRWADRLRGLPRARPSPRGYEAGWRATGRLGGVRVRLLPGGPGGLAGEARKRLGVAGALAPWPDGLGWWGEARPRLGPASCRITNHQRSPKTTRWEKNGGGIMAKSPRSVVKRGDVTRCSGRSNYPQRRGTRPMAEIITL